MKKTLIILFILVGFSSLRAQEVKELDTIKVTLLCRIEGRPWAFFKDGFEVRESYYYTFKFRTCTDIGCTVYHLPEDVKEKRYRHLYYLDNNKKRLRKEVIIYQKFPINNEEGKSIISGVPR